MVPRRSLTGLSGRSTLLRLGRPPLAVKRTRARNGTATGMNRIDRIDAVPVLFILSILLKMFEP